MQLVSLVSLDAAASLGAEHELWSTQASVAAVYRLSRLTACGIIVPGPGIEPVSPALAEGLLTTGPPGKPLSFMSFILQP